jgi:hypothetical protein
VGSTEAKPVRLILVVLLSLALPAAASAATGTEAGLYVGQTVWGAPACGQPHVEVSTPAEYLEAHGTGAFTGDPEAWADENRCAIVINPDFTIHTATKRCHVIVHEWGHLAGFRDPSNAADPSHSDNPHSVMYGEDLVSENRVRYSKRRVRWEAGGAFKPCYAASQPGTSFG